MKFFLRTLFFLSILFFFSGISAQTIWYKSSLSFKESFQKRKIAKPSQYELVDLNVSVIRKKCLDAHSLYLQNSNANIKGVDFEFPLPDGKMYNTSIVETTLWADKALEDRIGVKTYSMVNPITHSFDGNISVWNDKIEGILFFEKGNVYLNAVESAESNSHTHMSYFIKNSEMPALNCLIPENSNQNIVQNGKIAATDCKSMVYRLAVSATGEYTAWAGTVVQAQSYIAITMNIINAIYKNDLNVTFSLIDNTNIVFTDALTDPYTTGGASATLLNENQTVVNAYIGSAGYDVGILFTKASGGGLAQLSSVCESTSKARAACGYNSGTGSNPVAGPQGQWFNGAVAHELGHMFGATHTFAGTNSACGSNRTVSSSWEPGSGSTLMAYAAAGCGTTNSIQTYQDYYFHAGSIGQMQSFMASGGTCVTGITISNSAPTVTTLGTSFSIPANTPFVLTMNAIDAEGNTLTYTWDEMDASSSTTNQSVAPQPTNADGPMFRSLPAISNPTRYFPALSYLTSAASYAYEVLPSVARTLSFRGIARDNSSLGGCTSAVNVSLNVVNSSGFLVVSPTWGTIWTKNSASSVATVSWSVAGTDISPVSCSSVDILLSTDGGITFPITLASAVPNTGSFNVLIPSLNTVQARVMVKAKNNVFFNISTDNFAIVDPLPVTFGYFTAKKKESMSVLEWSTLSETNSSHFIIERSENGADFSHTVGKVKAAGNSSVIQNYYYTDIKPAGRWNYYRLKQVDMDGSVIYSPIKSIYFSGTNRELMTVYPNPVKNISTVSLYSDISENATISIYDNKGCLVDEKRIKLNVGINSIELDMKDFASGLYILKCFSNKQALGSIKVIRE